MKVIEDRVLIIPTEWDILLQKVTEEYLAMTQEEFDKKMDEPLEEL